MMNTLVWKCGCTGFEGNTQGAQYQDEIYGEGNRTHTPMVRENMYRCTVCGKEGGRPSKAESAKEKRARERAEKEAKQKNSPKSKK